METEPWKDVKDCEGLDQVSDVSRIKNLFDLLHFCITLIVKYSIELTQFEWKELRYVNYFSKQKTLFRCIDT